jgi:copper chaperone CopZ
MKSSNRIIVVVLCVIATGIISCSGPGKQTEKMKNPEASAKIEVSINGMSCASCEQAVQKNVAALNGIKSVKALASVGKAFIEYSPALVDTSKIRSAISEAGFLVSGFTAVAVSDPAK